ncbi:ABC transporter ATP-binding protein [Sellimonas intestinalis]|uniref:ABC transporter ATP-binding protein n=1 Tax=Sellimonas intestinalis TaxID=1653434 RepID=UPI0015EB9D5D|nr:ABC transporter ATP-binding protein [Sellimonas intestinalis]MBA2213300.1 ABC transporter ATP-binding protein [Sellimonas intestinalis]
MKFKKDFSVLFRLNKLIDFKSKILYIIGTIGIAGVFSGNKILTSFINKEILDAAIEMSISKMLTAVSLAIAVLICACILDPLSIYIFDYSIRRLVLGIQKLLFEKLQRLPLNYYQKNHSGDILSRINSSVESIEMAYSMHLYRLVEATVWGVGSLVAMVVIDWRLTLLILAYTAIVILFNGKFVEKVRVMEDKLQLNNAKNVENYEEVIRGIKVIKSFGIEDKLQAKFDDSNNEFAENKVKRGEYDARISSMNYVFSKLNLFFLITIGGFMAFNKIISFGNILALVGLQSGVSNMFSNVGGIMNDIQGACAGAGRVFEILDEQEEDTEKGQLFVDKNNDTALEIRNLNFSYDDNKTLSNISFDVKKGEYIAIIGNSGSGKSTLAKILLGLYNSEFGSISLFGNSNRDISINEWRKKIAYVSQNPFLFDRSIRDNIMFGREDADEKMIIEAAKKADAHDFIINLENGYDYNVGENGNKLSGGQKQRIALSRAIIKGAEIIIIDEGTSALDKVSESIVQNCISMLKGDRTIIQIIHNLDMMKEADRVLVIENGGLVKSGKPEEIII